MTSHFVVVNPESGDYVEVPASDHQVEAVLSLVQDVSDEGLEIDEVPHEAQPTEIEAGDTVQPEAGTVPQI